jgi:lysozyme
VLTWLRLVGRYYGQKPIIYTSTDFINLYLTPEITENYQIWISDFRDRDPVISNWYIWQFTDKAVVYGVPGNVDLNVMKIK